MTEKLNTQQRMDKVVELIHERNKLQKDFRFMQQRNSDIGKEIYSLLQLWEDADPVAVMSQGEVYIVSPSQDFPMFNVDVQNVQSMMYEYYNPDEL